MHIDISDPAVQKALADLDQVRKARNLTYQAIADAIGLSLRGVTNWIEPSLRPARMNDRTLYKIQEFLRKQRGAEETAEASR